VGGEGLKGRAVAEAEDLDQVFALFGREWGGAGGEVSEEDAAHGVCGGEVRKAGVGGDD